jgi:hypothetical protein
MGRDPGGSGRRSMYMENRVSGNTGKQGWRNLANLDRRMQHREFTAVFPATPPLV